MGQVSTLLGRSPWVGRKDKGQRGALERRWGPEHVGGSTSEKKELWVQSLLDVGVGSYPWKLFVSWAGGLGLPESSGAGDWESRGRTGHGPVPDEDPARESGLLCNVTHAPRCFSAKQPHKLGSKFYFYRPP